LPADEKKNTTPETYDALVERLQHVVERLETGELSLEDSLKEFEDGIRLVRKGEELLNRAEQRIEELLTEGGKDAVAPLEPGSNGRPAPRAPKAPARGNARGDDDDDVPF
jgi:exodeoxyribonuclease VII small subunit